MDEREMFRRREEMEKRSREEATSIMQLAGFEIRQCWELANGYWPLAPEYDDVRTPWWLLMTDVGLIRIGRRKRVIEIDWVACAIRATVTSDDVTKSDSYVHAYTAAKAVEYMTVLRRAGLKSRVDSASHVTMDGIYKKFSIHRTDGSSERGGKHEKCDYFVLDWSHDPFTIPAMRAYAAACEETNPELASDLRDRCEMSELIAAARDDKKTTP